MSPVLGTVLLLVGLMNDVTANSDHDPAIHEEELNGGGWSTHIEPKDGAKLIQKMNRHDDPEELNDDWRHGAKVIRQAHPQKFPAIDGPCGDGWSHIDPERCAKFFDSPKTFSDAEVLCRSFGGNLLTIHNVFQQRKVLLLVLRHKTQMPSLWLGAARWGSEVSFSNLDGSDMDFVVHWLYKPGAPHRAADCVATNSDAWGFWMPEDCTEEKSFICTKKM